jgi:hypothetical protein
VIDWRGARFVFRTVAKRAELALEDDAPAQHPVKKHDERARPTTRAPRVEPPKAHVVRDTFWRLAFALALLAAIAAVLIWARARHGLSVDAWIDRVLDRFAGER